MKAYGKLTLRGDVWHIDAAPHVHMRAKRIFGKLRDQSRGILMLSHTPELCADLQWFMGRYPLEMDAATARTLAAHAARHRDRIARLEDLLDTRYDPPTFALAKPARTYQAREAALLLEAGGLLVGDDVGLGKTVTGICVMSDPRALPAVVVCQTHLTRQWRAKVQEFAPELKVHIIKRRNPYELPTHMGAGPDVVICSYGMVTGGWSKVLARYAKFVIFDEVQELRHMGTQRYGAALDLCEALPYRMGLSATPIYNYGAEIFSVLDLLRPGCLGTFEEFHTEWCGKNDILKDPKAFGTWARDNFLIVRHTRAEARLAEQQHKLRSRELLQVDEVQRVWMAEVTAVRATVLNSYATAADRVFRAAKIDGVAGVEAELKAIAYDVLRELSEDDRPMPDIDGEAPEDEDHDGVSRVTRGPMPDPPAPVVEPPSVIRHDAFHAVAAMRATTRETK